MIFWSPGVVMSMIKQLFAVLSMHTISGRLTLSVCTGKSHKILHPSFSNTESGAYSCHLSLRFRWNLVANLLDLFIMMAKDIYFFILIFFNWDSSTLQYIVFSYICCTVSRKTLSKRIQIFWEDKTVSYKISKLHKREQ